MGMNTAAIIRNDFLHEIEKDPDFGKKVAEAVRANGDERVMSYHGQGFDVLPCSHADNVQVIAISGNTIRRLGFGGGYLATDEDILRNLARNMGFRIVKAPR
jgi:hypothetical protein